MGVNRTYYLLWESGQQTPSPATLTRLADVLEVGVAALVGVDVRQAPLQKLRQLVG